MRTSLLDIVDRVRSKQPPSKRAVERPAPLELDAVTAVLPNARRVLVTDDRARALDVARGHAPALIDPSGDVGPFTVYALGVSR